MPNPPATEFCPECKRSLPRGLPLGICPACALQVAIPVDPGAGSPPDAPASPPKNAKAAAGARDFDLPREFGDYLLLERVARGGTSVVYRARQLSLNRIVALKMLLDGTEAREELVKRFQTEASAAGSLRHPNITAIHDIGVHEGRPFITMDFVAGSTLAHRAASGLVTPRRAAEYVRDVALAIQHAHDKNVLHRDLKPSNILIDEQDQVHVTDFGLARRVDGISDLTVTGQVLGSPAYMPPEQASGRRELVTARSDVYGLGAILYHLISGRAPFRGDTITDTLRQVVDQDPINPRFLNAGIPPDLETICLKCLEKDPARRYPSAQAVADELDRFLKDEPIEARRPSIPEKLLRWGRRNRLAAAFGLTLMLALVSVIGLAINVHLRAVSEETHRVETQELVRLQKNLLRQQANLLREQLDKVWEDRLKLTQDLKSENIYTLMQQPEVALPKDAIPVRWVFGMIAGESPTDQVRYHFPMLSTLETNLASRLGRPMRLDVRLFKRHEDITQALESNQITFTRMGALRYLRTEQAQLGLHPLTVPVFGVKTGLLCTLPASGITNWDSLRGRSIALGDTNASISFNALIQLAERGLSKSNLSRYEHVDLSLELHDLINEVGLEKALEKVGYMHSHAGALREVIEGRFDVAVTSQKAFYVQNSIQGSTPAKQALVMIPGTEFPSSRTVMVASPGLPEADREHLTAVLVDLVNHGGGGWMELLPERSIGFRRLEPDDFAFERKWLRRIDELFPPHPAPVTTPPLRSRP